MQNRRTKGHKHVWLVTVLLGWWLALGGVACPLYCHCATPLYIYCDNRNVSDTDFASLIENSPSEATFIDLSNNNLSTFPQNVFSKFSELVSIDASNNEFEGIPKNVFYNLPVFQKLFMDGNKVSRLENRTFSNMRQLNEVYLNRNRISFVDVCAFIETTNLRILGLSHNELTLISTSNMESLKTLTSLDISYNKIEKLADNAFKNLVNLKTLQASYNNISLITTLTFHGLTELEYLYLDGNNIHELYHDYFLPFRKTLKILSLSFNKIRQLGSKLFLGMTFLETLDLSFNEINFLGNNIVPGLSLTEVKLQGNKLGEITQNAFGLSRKVSDMDLSFNEIKSFAIGAFNSFKESVYKLNLEGNYLTQILTGMFDGMKYLQSLNLANNSISFIQEGAFRDLVNLNFLDLTHNNLMMITPEMFQGVLALKRLDLHYNPLRQFEWYDFSMHQSNFVINLNLSFENVTHTSANVKWPYVQGSQIYWSQYVKCLEADQCPFRTQAEFLAPYSKEVTIGNFSPSSTYYVCVNPAFKETNIQVRQCGVITTQRIVTSPTTAIPEVTAAISSKAASFTMTTLHYYLYVMFTIPLLLR